VLSFVRTRYDYGGYNGTILNSQNRDAEYEAFLREKDEKERQALLKKQRFEEQKRKREEEKKATQNNKL